MPEIRPFRGLRYAVPDAELEKVLAPPYDVIPDTYRDELYARDPRNIVRVILNRVPEGRRKPSAPAGALAALPALGLFESAAPAEDLPSALADALAP